jgi:hypothetical protein
MLKSCEAFFVYTHLNMANLIPFRKRFESSENRSVDKYWGTETKNIKNSLLAMPVLRTWRRDCVVGGMETRFQ